MVRAVSVLRAACWVVSLCAPAVLGAENADLPDIFSQDAARFRSELQSALPELRVAGVQGLSYLRHHSFEGDLIRALEDPDAGVRREAALGLARLGRRGSVPPLIVRLADSSHEVRTQAALALAAVTDHTPPADVVSQSRRGLSDPKRARQEAATAKRNIAAPSRSRFGEDTVCMRHYSSRRGDAAYWREWWGRLSPDAREDALIAQLAKPERRLAALRGLRRLGGGRTEAALLELAGKDKLPRKQMHLLIEAIEPVATAKSLPLLKGFCGHVPAAAWGLGNIGGPEAEKILLDALRGPDLHVMANLDRLGSAGAFRHAPMLVRAFGLVSYRSQPDDLHAPPAPVQRLASRLLIRTGRAHEIVDLILAKLDGKPATTTRPGDKTIEALQRVAKEMEPELRPGFHRADGYAKSIPLCAMSHMVRDPALAERLIPLLDHPAYVVRVYVAAALGRLRATQAVEPIAKILREGYPFADPVAQDSGKHGPKTSRFVRWKAYLAMALGHIGDDAARKTLEALVVDPAAPRDIRFGATVGLGVIASEKSRDALTKAANGDLVRWIRESAQRALHEIEIRTAAARAQLPSGATGSLPARAHQQTFAARHWRASRQWHPFHNGHIMNPGTLAMRRTSNRSMASGETR